MIKRVILFAVVGLALIATESYGQNIKASVMAGMNLAQLDGDEVYGYSKPGLNLGVQAMAPIGKSFFLTLETNFNQKGAYQKAQDPSEDLTKEYDVTLNYVEIPVLLHYNDKDVLTGGIGFAYARLLSADEEEHSGNVEPYTTIKEFNQSDWLGLFDLQFRVYKQFYANLRYSYSIFPVRKRAFESVSSGGETWTRQQYNNTLMLRVAYRINEKLSTKSKAQRR